MSIDELEIAIWNLIDENCNDFSDSEYMQLLYNIADDAKTRAQAIETNDED